jgi:hypothetical protein
MGRVKLPYNDLCILTQSELNWVVEGHEIDIKDTWERERISAYLSVSPHLKKGESSSPEKLWPLPWDANKFKKIVVENFKEKAERFKQIIKKIHGES